MPLIDPFSPAQIFETHLNLNLRAVELKTGAVERRRPEKKGGVVGGSDSLFRNAEIVLVQLAATGFVVDDANRISAVGNPLEDIEIRLPYLVQPAFSERMFRLSRKSMLVIEKRDAKIACAIVGVEHGDHDATGLPGLSIG